MKRSSLAALLLVALALPLVARSLGTTRPLAQIPLTPSRAQRSVFEPWTEEERAFYQTFQISYALRGLAPLERWEQELLSADSLLKATQAQVADSISVFRGAVRALEEEHMATSEEGPSPERSAALMRLEGLLEDIGQLQSRLWEDERELQRLLYVDDAAVARRDSMQRWRELRPDEPSRTAHPALGWGDGCHDDADRGAPAAGGRAARQPPLPQRQGGAYG